MPGKLSASVAISIPKWPQQKQHEGNTKGALTQESQQVTLRSQRWFLHAQHKWRSITSSSNCCPLYSVPPPPALRWAHFLSYNCLIWLKNMWRHTRVICRYIKKRRVNSPLSIMCAPLKGQIKIVRQMAKLTLQKPNFSFCPPLPEPFFRFQHLFVLLLTNKFVLGMWLINY